MTWYVNAARDPDLGPIAVEGRNVSRAKGYSPLELERAGLDPDRARGLGIAVDEERESMVGSNVLQLRALLERA